MGFFDYVRRRKGNRCKTKHRRVILEPLEQRYVLSGLSILGHSPTEVRNEVFDFVEVEFSQPIAPESFTTDDVQIAGPTGSIDATAVESIEGNTYRVRFPALTVRGSYQLQIGPEIVDAAGDLLDQNENGVWGETDQDVFEAILVYIEANVVLDVVTVIGDGDTTFDGQDLLIDGTTVMIDGSHRFGSIHLINGATVTHSAASEDTVSRLDLQIGEDAVIDSASRIDVSGKGYLPGRTVGNTTTGAASGIAGGVTAG